MEIKIAAVHNIRTNKIEYEMTINGETTAHYATLEDALDAVDPPLSPGRKESILGQLNQSKEVNFHAE